MTTERRQPRIAASPLELRLYLAALLAAVYAISWRAIGGHERPPPANPQEGAIATTTIEPPRLVWIDDLPVDMRPAIALPAGWQRVAEPPPPTTTQPARVERVPSRRVPRVRTRSS